jgi:hypothetical protein
VAVAVVVLAGVVVAGVTVTGTPTGTQFPPTATPIAGGEGGGAAALSTPETATDDGTPAGDAAARYRGLRPTCERPPELVVAVQVGALRTDNGTNEGIRTVRAFASPGNRQSTGSFDNFVSIVRSDPYDELLDHVRAEYDAVSVTGDSAAQDVTVVDAGGNRTTYRFRLERQAGGSYDGCWLTTGVLRMDSEPATTAAPSPVENGTTTASGDGTTATVSGPERVGSRPASVPARATGAHARHR